MTGRTALAEWSLLDLVEILDSNECQCGCTGNPPREECATEIRTRLTILNDKLDLPGIAMDRAPIRALVMGDRVVPGAWSNSRILR